MDVHKKQPPGHILLFLPGESEITQVCKMLNFYAPDIETRPLFARLPGNEQKLALDGSGKGRKCIASTNVAETSLTIDGVVYVIDSGLSRQMIYNPRLNMDVLDVAPISQASANQRMGRAGRTRPGVCYRLYSKQTFDELQNSTTPAVRCRPVHRAVLKLVASGTKRPIDFAWIDAPHPESIARAAQDLKDWYV